MLHCWGYSRLIGKLFELFSNNILCTCVMTADFWNQTHSRYWTKLILNSHDEWHSEWEQLFPNLAVLLFSNRCIFPQNTVWLSSRQPKFSLTKLLACYSVLLCGSVFVMCKELPAPIVFVPRLNLWRLFQSLLKSLGPENAHNFIMLRLKVLEFSKAYQPNIANGSS